MALARKAAPPPETTEFEAAQARWHEVRNRRRKLMADLEAARMAADAAHIRDRDTIPPKPREKIENFLAGRRLNSDQLAKLILDLEARIEEFQSEYLTEAESWEQARSREAARINAQATPAHKAIVARICEAVQQLSDVIVEEQQLLGTVRAAGGTLESVGEPFGTLSTQNSMLNRWRSLMAVRGLV
ncbi:hypothetical protein [Geminicoccus flavidas]|uniref:hypothetical protein n=1 Tax=Geminicoccus flavidas TaxID=2506407 RepID=UPI00135AD12B|nr:hypothetical protein [Geminicoccus flavidas]